MKLRPDGRIYMTHRRLSNVEACFFIKPWLNICL